MHGTAKRRTTRCAIKHFLLTIQIAGNERLHCYLATDDRRDTIDAAARMLSEAEKAGVIDPLSSAVLVTPLSADVGAVRKIVASRSAEAKRLLNAATDFHFSIFATAEGDPADALLLAMH
jgi:hypothetical protein